MTKRKNQRKCRKKYDKIELKREIMKKWIEVHPTALRPFHCCFYKIEWKERKTAENVIFIEDLILWHTWLHPRSQFRCLAFGAIEWCKLFANVDGGGKSPVQRIKLSQLKISRTTFTTLQWVAGRHLLIRTLTVAVSAWSMVQSAWQKSKNSNYNK